MRFVAKYLSVMIEAAEKGWRLILHDHFFPFWDYSEIPTLSCNYMRIIKCALKCLSANRTFHRHIKKKLHNAFTKGALDNNVAMQACHLTPCVNSIRVYPEGQHFFIIENSIMKKHRILLKMVIMGYLSELVLHWIEQDALEAFWGIGTQIPFPSVTQHLSGNFLKSFGTWSI